MKLLRFGEPGKERPGVLDGSGRLHDLSGVIPDVTGATLSPASLGRLGAIDPRSLPLVEGNVRIGPCVNDVRNFYGIGRNYADHAAEAAAALPVEAPVFTKATSSICGPNDDVVIPPGAQKCDWEVELALVIGSPAYNIAAADAMDYIAGYCICNDVSERAWQIESTGHAIKGKSAPTFGPIGPWLVTKDEVPNPGALDLWLELNGERVQNSNTRHLIFGIPELIATCSKYMRLMPGDIISTGTPSGVGMGMKPQRWLRPGDVMHLGVAGLGEQTQTCVAYSG